MMFVPSIREMLTIHLLIGFCLTLFVAIKAFRRQNNPPRWFADFGPGFWGTQGKWLQWYTWALGFEILTSLLYKHTGLFYYEVACSPFEAVALVLGAFIVDRSFDFLVGVPDLSIEIPHIHVDSEKIKATVDEVKRRADRFKTDMATSVEDTVSRATSSVRTATKAPEVDKDTLAKENKAFDDLIKGR